MLATLPRFPCGHHKRPLTGRGFLDAKFGVDDRGFPLVGIPTGAVSGLDVVDIDPPNGIDWYKREFDALPMTRAHETRSGGLHLLFRHADGVRNSTGKIAPNIDVRGDGGYFIDWSREGLPFEDWPICEWPGWLLELAIGTQRDLGHKPLVRVMDAALRVGGPLGELDVTQYRNYGDWLRLMMACHAAGIGREDWIEWCLSDPAYAEDRDEIERLWDCLKVDRITAWALRVEVRLAQLNRGVCPKHPYPKRPYPTTQANTSKVPSRGDLRPVIGVETRDLPRRWASLSQVAQRDEPGAFWASCVMREIIAEGRVKPEVAIHLLRSVGVPRRVIAAGFLTVEDKLGGSNEQSR
jgi:hypothetical protein